MSKCSHLNAVGIKREIQLFLPRFDRMRAMCTFQLLTGEMSGGVFVPSNIKKTDRDLAFMLDYIGSQSME